MLDNNQFLDIVEGTPQGGVISPLLANIALQCTHWGLTCQETDLIDVDHIVPKSQGGDNTYKNKQVLHRHGHDSKTVEDIKAVTQ